MPRKSSASRVARPIFDTPFDLDYSLKRALTDANSSQKEELKAARRDIAERNLPADQAIRSFERAADAIKNGIRVFISYKHIQRELAEEFRDKIRTYGESRLAKDRDDQPWVFIAEQGLEAGKDWRKRIHEEMEKAHWFFLLLPDVQVGREWEIYEAGYFLRGMTDSEPYLCSSRECSSSLTIRASPGFRELTGRAD